MARAAELPTVLKDTDRSLVEQITAHFAAAIDAGRLASGDRLPTIRAVAESAGVTRTTVQQAYRRLATRGLVASTVGRGTQVIAGDPGAVGPISRAAATAFAHVQRTVPVPELPAGREEVANFQDLLPDPELFPTDELRSSLDSVLRTGGGQLLGYGDPVGSLELRRELAARHGVADGHPEPGDVLITNGAQQGIALVLRTFTSPGDEVAVAIPTYHQLFGVLKAQGLGIAPIESGSSVVQPGFDLDELRAVLERPAVRLLYVMPTFANPTGHTMTREQREALMDVVTRTQVPVLEDEFECELRAPDDPLPTLSSLDPRGLTATVRSFSKGLFPGTRLGWVVGAAPVLGPMAALKQFTDLESSPLLQAALLDFLRRGAMDRYLDVLRSELTARHAAARAALSEHLPEGCRWSEPSGGLALWVELSGGVDSARVADQAALRGVRVTPGRVFDPLARPSSGLRLSVARATPDRIPRGIRVLGECVRVVAAPSAQPPLL